MLPETMPPLPCALASGLLAAAYAFQRHAGWFLRRPRPRPRGEAAVRAAAGDRVGRGEDLTSPGLVGIRGEFDQILLRTW